MNCLFLFKSKKPKSVNKDDEESRGKESLQKSSPENIRELRKQGEQNLRVFSYKELSHATRDFIRKLKIGEGGFGCVYKATIPNYSTSDPNSPPLIVAIKKLNQQGLQGHKQWLAEVQFLGVVNHPNVVRLLGYCSEDKETEIQRLLVYEFMSNLSLEDHLFTRTTPTLPWKQRLKIMLGAAQGLAYLHEIQVIYRDFKSSNVLLDNDFNPKLSDFGLAREGPEGDETHVTTARVGTQGYAAPEYVQTGHLKTQSDVYSFGVVLYEIITGRRAIDRRRPIAQQKLLEWVKQYPVESKSFCMIIDSKLRNNYSIDTVKRVAKLADHCLKKIDKERPTMDFVVDSLKKIIQELDKSA